MSALDRVILALDGLALSQMLTLISRVGKRVRGVKVHDAYDRNGPSVVEWLKHAGARSVWVDYKLHDTPDTVAKRAKAIAVSGADMLTVHIAGGRDMMVAAKDNFPGEVFGISVLTSLDPRSVEFTFGRNVALQVKIFAKMADDAGLRGGVCWPQEVARLRQEGDLHRLKLVIPGTRSPGKSTDDQARTDTPANAIRAGATYLVIGRQVTQAADPVAALDELEAEIQAAHDETMTTDPFIAKLRALGQESAQ